MAKGWTDAAGSADVSEGEVAGVKLGERHVAICRLNGRLYATSDVCTHEFALLSAGWMDDGVIECPLHGARFDMRDGRCFGPMASEDLTVYAIREEDGRVQIALDGVEDDDVT